MLRSTRPTESARAWPFAMQSRDQPKIIHMETCTFCGFILRGGPRPTQSIPPYKEVQNPSIFGNFKPEVYVDWELKVEQILDYFNLHGRKLVRLVTLEFGDYALRLEQMMRRFVPPSYTRDLHNKFQRLYQGSRSVKEYHKEMEMDLMRAQIR
ncbi:hypothetical protein CR513_47694, partial [Mucuna pruriens]